MNRTKLKSYAPQARRDFIQAVTDRAGWFGLTEKGIEPMTESGDTVIIGGRPFPRAVAAKRKALAARIERQGFRQTMEALAYTWFNRLVAIRYLELHGFLDHGFRVLSHPDPEKKTPEIIEQAEHVTLPGITPGLVIELKLEGTKEAELYRRLLVAQCNALHAGMPFLFERIEDETELVLPDNLLHTDSLIRKLVAEIPEEDWQEVEIIGWLYQFYISDKKDEVIGKVVKSEDIPAATQLFTPNWIVKYMVQNSLGRMWLATYPDSALRHKMEFYIEPAEQTPEVTAQLASLTPKELNPESITLLDPACGSGHILVEAYEVLKEIYQERGYRNRDIPRLILEKNLFGLDIDDRAAQLAAFALLMKARQDDRRILQEAPRLNVFSIRESSEIDAKTLLTALGFDQKQGFLPPTTLFAEQDPQPLLAVTQPPEQAFRNDLEQLLTLFQHGKTFGSLIRIPDSLAAKLPALAEFLAEKMKGGGLFEKEAAARLLPFVEQGKVLARKYDCVVANPPYMGGKGMNPSLKDFANKQFPKGKSDLFAMFIERGCELAKPNGQCGLITMQSWMFLTSFEDLRQTILNTKTIDSMAHLGPRAFSEISGEVVQTTAFILLNKHFDDYQPTFFRLIDGNEDEKKISLLSKQNIYQNTKQKDFRKIPGSPIAYWISDKMIDCFSLNKSLSFFAETKQGLSTSDNDRFLRYFFEVSYEKTGFSQNHSHPVQIGKKWIPFNKGGEFKKWFGNNEYLVNWENNGQEIKSQIPKSVIRNESFYFKKGITWSALSSSSLSMRAYDEKFIFADKGQALFPIKESDYNHLLAFLNSIVTEKFLTILTPTLDFHSGYISKLPIVEIKGKFISQDAISLAKSDWNSFETSWDFTTFPMLSEPLCAPTVAASFHNWQAQCTANIQRMQELETENNRLFIEAYGLQEELTPEVPEDQITLARADRSEDVKRLVSYFVGIRMGRYSLDQPGLVYAQSGNQGFEAGNYVKFAADDDGIIPITEENWFGDDAANQFFDFIACAWPAENMEANLAWIAESLGGKTEDQPRAVIRKYFSTQFFKDHLRTYKRRPIYWMFASGKQRAFQCLVYLHRYHGGTLARMRTDYVIPLQGKIGSRIDQLSTDIQAAASTSHRRKLEKERDTLLKQQVELQAFDEKLRHYADMRIALDLDDGVKVNYGKFGDLLAEVKAVTGGTEE